MNVTRDALPTGSYSTYRKVGVTRVSDFTVPPGTTFETPEGLRADDEECRVAIDSQGGVYPIRESVFRETYERACATCAGPLPRENAIYCSANCAHNRRAVAICRRCGNPMLAPSPTGLCGFCNDESREAR